MIHISNFDVDFKGRKFKNENGTEFTVVGYGDNQGNPYLLGLNNDNGKVTLRSTLLKNVEFVP
jgi:5,10-methylene-tetrahydrofolate dehydrogenase/methenyl tetrahydrofolate cyclohydrolase